MSSAEDNPDSGGAVSSSEVDSNSDPEASSSTRRAALEGNDNEDEVSSSSTSALASEMQNDDKEDGISSTADIGVSKGNTVFAFVEPTLPPPFAAVPSSKARKPATPNDPGPSPPPVSSSSSSSHKRERSSREKQEKYNAILSTLKYRAPEHAAPSADSRYNLEVLKNGIIVDSIKFDSDDSKGYYIVGRVPGCDVVAENPTVSRLHAVLQFILAPPKEIVPGMEGTEEDSSENPQETGLYIYDLNSTHGTFINKNQVFPQRYYRVHVGHVLKFGSSQRMYIVNGPSADEEAESEKSVTELMNEKLEKDLERKRKEEEEQLKRGVSSSSGSGSKLPKENIEEEGIDWGMGEDADEGSDMKINPFAMDYEASELTLDNPKKTLRSWFDREGHDLEYEMREKGNGQYVCRIGLPLDGPTDAPVYAESEVKGKKKEAAHDAALKACQILDSHGILTASNQEARKRKERRYEDDDYYSSDDDTFLDRTGSIEKKREKRMRLAGKIEEKVETFDSLSQKYAELEKEIAELKSKVEKSQEMKTRADEGDIDIDDYMKMLKSGVFDVKKLKTRLKEANEELQKTKKLMNIARPAELPSYLQGKAPVQTSTSASTSKSEETKETSSSPERPSPSRKEIPTEQAEADDSRESPSTSKSPQKSLKRPMVGPMKPPKPVATPEPPKPKIFGLIKPSDIAALKLGIRPQDEDRPSIPLKDELEEEDEGEENASSSEDEGGREAQEPGESSSSSPPKKKKRQRYRNKYRKQHNTSGSDKYDHDDPKYSTWVPPKDQTGDGRTSLNEKLGY